MRTKWKEIPITQKIIMLLSISVSTLVVVFAALQLLNVWNRAVNVCVPLLGVVNSCQAYLQWKTSRKTAYFCIVTAIIIFICSFVIFFI